MEIVLVGLNFRTAPVEVREKVSFSGEQAQRAAEELRSRGILEETLVGAGSLLDTGAARRS